MDDFCYKPMGMNVYLHVVTLLDGTLQLSIHTVRELSMALFTIPPQAWQVTEQSHWNTDLLAR
jgi:hypothetical protein